MKLEAWVQKQVEDTGQTETAIIKALAGVAGVSTVTLHGAKKGALIGLYKVAKAISKATGGQVTTLDLCEHDPSEALRQIQEQVQWLT